LRQGEKKFTADKGGEEKKDFNHPERQGRRGNPDQAWRTEKTPKDRSRSPKTFPGKKRNITLGWTGRRKSSVRNERRKAATCPKKGVASGFPVLHKEKGRKKWPANHI